VLSGTIGNNERVCNFLDDSSFNHSINCDCFIYSILLNKIVRLKMIEVRTKGDIYKPCSDIPLNGRGMKMHVAKDEFLD